MFYYNNISYNGFNDFVGVDGEINERKMNENKYYIVEINSVGTKFWHKAADNFAYSKQREAYVIGQLVKAELTNGQIDYYDENEFIYCREDNVGNKKYYFIDKNNKGLHTKCSYEKYLEEKTGIKTKSCEGKLIIIDGKEYKLVEVK